MKLKAALICQEREQRAWSQEHLAGATGLALRTIQRIESAGSASYESANAIAAVLGLPLSTLRSEAAARTGGAHRWITPHHLLTLLGCLLVAAIVTPPNWRLTIGATVAFWLSCELAIKTRRSARSGDQS